MLIKIAQFISRFQWGQNVLLALFSITSSVFFNHTMIWPRSGKLVRVVVFATDKFSLASCIDDMKSDLYEGTDNVETIS